MFLKSSLWLEESVELTAPDEWHYEEKSKVGHEEVLHTDKELVLTFEHDILFQFSVLDLVILNKDILSNNFDGIQLLIMFKFCKENFAERSFTKNDDHFEVGECRNLLFVYLGISGHEDRIPNVIDDGLTEVLWLSVSKTFEITIFIRYLLVAKGFHLIGHSFEVIVFRWIIILNTPRVSIIKVIWILVNCCFKSFLQGIEFFLGDNLFIFQSAFFSW